MYAKHNMAPNPSLQAAYDYCLRRAQSHYENFPVASRLLPARIRYPIAVIYTFARNADDFADEGTDSAEARLEKLSNYQAELDQIALQASSHDPVFTALQDVIRNFNLPLTLFSDLLTAFRMDVTTKRYARHEDILNYCRYSANPVGRLLLHLHGKATPTNLVMSDAICSALQLINFYQDIQQDLVENNRIYIPTTEFVQFKVGEEQIRAQHLDTPMISLMQHQYERARQLMLQGAPLGNQLQGRFGLELRIIIRGGLTILDKLRASPEHIFQRPRLTKADWLGMVLPALFNRIPS